MTVGVHTRVYVCVRAHSHVHTCLWHLFPKSVCVSVEACAEATRIYVPGCLHSALVSGVGALSFGFGDFLLGLCPPLPPFVSTLSPSLLPKGFRWASDNLTLFMESRKVSPSDTFPYSLESLQPSGWAVAAGDVVGTNCSRCYSQSFTHSPQGLFTNFLHI